MAAYEQCKNCNGGGEVVGLYGMVVCPWCDGEGAVVIRDANGRFAKPEQEDSHVV